MMVERDLLNATCHDLDLRSPVARVHGCADVDWVDGEYAMYLSRVLQPDADSGRTQRYFKIHSEHGGPWYEVVDELLHLVMLRHSTPDDDGGSGRWEVGLISEGGAWLNESLPRAVCYAPSADTPPTDGWQSEYGGVAASDHGAGERRCAMTFQNGREMLTALSGGQAGRVARRDSQTCKIGKDLSGCLLLNKSFMRK